MCPRIGKRYVVTAKRFGSLAGTSESKRPSRNHTATKMSYNRIRYNLKSRGKGAERKKIGKWKLRARRGY